MKTVGAGALAGAAATGAMSAFMFAAWRSGWLGPKPPEQITARLLRRAGFDPPKKTQDVAASVMHVGFGMGAGSAFAFLRRLDLPLPGVVQGILYGTAVWAVSYAGWVPALGLMPPPQRDRPGRPAVMLAAHWVYGAALALLAPAGEAA